MNYENKNNGKFANIYMPIFFLLLFILIFGIFIVKTKKKEPILKNGCANGIYIEYVKQDTTCREYVNIIEECYFFGVFTEREVECEKIPPERIKAKITHENIYFY